jgi:hypothetical protein
MDHGRQSSEIVNREKHMSAFHLYITDTKTEIDCISIRESMVAGAIPLVSNFGVFKEREGYHFEVTNEQSLKACAPAIVNLFGQKEMLEEYRKELVNAKSIVSWPDIAKQWLTFI